MAFSYNKKNLANTTITGAITPTQTSVTVADATVFSYAFFYATLMPSNEMSNASNSEIVLVTNIQGNTLTLVRGQENTIARSFPYGAVITNGIYTRDIDYARSIGRKVFMARDDGTDDTNTSYQIVDPMIKNIPEEGSIITVEFDTPSYGAPTLGVNNGVGGLVQVSGTDIHITDSSGQVDSVGLYGDTQQQTYSGKNLFDYTKLTTINYGVNNGDGTLTSNQFTNATWSGLTANFTSIPITDEFTVSMEIRLTQGSTGVLNKINDGVTDMTPVLKPNVSTQWQKYAFKKTPSTGYSINRFYVQFQSINGSFEIKNLQIELGSQATSFEPYVGGTASPNPDYPQEVQTVTGRQTVTVAVKNKINIANGTGTRGNNTVVASGQTVTVNTSGGSGTESAWYLNDCSIIQQYAASYSTARDYHLTTAGGTYTVTVYYENMPSSTGTLHCYVYTNKQAKILNRNMVVDNKIVWTVTLEADEYIKSAMIYTAAANVFSNFKTRIQIEKGSTATPYVPYQGQSYEINLGKNLFDKDNVNTISAYIESSGSHGIVNDSASTCIWIPCETNTTYTISRTAGNVFRAVTTSSTPTTGITTSNYVGNDSGASITISTGADGKYIVIEVRNYSSSSSLDDILATIQLERGSTATTYAPYFTPIELCKIGTYQDYIYKSGENWYVKKNIGKSAMGSLTWNPASTGTSGVYRMYSDGITSTVLIPPTGSEIAKIVCSHYTPETAANTWSAMVGVAVQTTDGRLFVYDSAYNTNTSQSAFTTWLTNNNVVLYYALATPTDTQITNATLIAQLNALNNMLPEGVADVVVTGDLPGSLTIKYYQQGTGTHTAPIVGGAEIDGGDNEQVVELDSYLPYRLVYDTNGYWRVLNKGPKVTTGAIADGAVTPEKLSVNPGKYSAAETIIGSWIDGRPVYRKVLTGTTPSNANAATLQHGISDFYAIISVKGYLFMDPSNTSSQPIARVVADNIATYGIGVGDFTPTTFFFGWGNTTNYRGKPYYIVLEYIKTS